MPSSASSPLPAQPQAQSKVTRPLQAVLILGILTLVARLTGLIQRQVISALLPTAATEAYSAAFGLPDALNYIVAGGAISITFIPIFTQFWNGGDQDEAWSFFSTLASVMSVALAVITLGMMIWTPQLMLLLLPGLGDAAKAETFDLAVQMTRIILPAQLFFYLGGLLVGVLNTFKRFSATGWTSALNNTIAISLGIVLLPFFGPIGFAWGILAGAFGGNLLLPMLAASNGPRVQRPRFRWRFAPSDPQVRRFFTLALPIVFSVSLPIVDQYVVRYFASGLPLGTLTYLENANRLMIAAQGVLGQAAAVAAFPYLAGEVASGNFRAFTEFLRGGLRRLLFAALPVSVLLILWSQPLTRLIYGYGQFNTPQKLSETALYFALYCIGLFAWVAQGLVARGFYALGDTRTPTLVGGVLTVLFFIPLCALMARFYGAPGLALATTIGAASYFLGVLLLLDRKLARAPYSAPLGLDKIGGTLLRTTAACALMGLAGVLALRGGELFCPDTKLGDLCRILGSGAVATFVFCTSATQFEIPEWHWLRSKLRRRKRA